MSVYAQLLFSWLPAWLAGLALVQLLWPRRGPAADLALKLALAPGLGWGLSTSLAFFGLLAFGPGGAGLAGLEWALALGLAALAARRGGLGWPPPAACPTPRARWGRASG